MLTKSTLRLLAVVFMVSVSLLSACDRSTRSISTAPPATSETPTIPESSATSETPTAITPIVWSPDLDCAGCHVMQSYVDSLQNSSLMVSAHAQKGFVCLSCHEQELLAEVHEDLDPSTTSIEERMFPQEFCLGCHGSYTDLITLTEDSEALTSIVNVAVNPHDSHEGEVDCYYCHKMHETVKPVDYCFGCH